IEAGRADDDDGGYPPLPGKTVLDRVEGLKPIWAKVTTADRRQHDGGRHRDTADPDNHGEDMKGSRDDDIVHDQCSIWRDRVPAVEPPVAPAGRATGLSLP